MAHLRSIGIPWAITIALVALGACRDDDVGAASRTCWIDVDGRTICVVDDGGPGPGDDAASCDGGGEPTGDGGGEPPGDGGPGDARDGGPGDARDGGPGDARDGGPDGGPCDGGPCDGGPGDGGLDGGPDGGPDDGGPGDGGLDGGPEDAGVDAPRDASPDAPDAGSCGNGVCEYTVDNTGTCPTVTAGSETPQNCAADCNCCDYSIDICGQFGNGTCNYDELETTCTGRRTWCAWGPDHVSDCCGDGYCDADAKHALYPDRPGCGAASGPPTYDRGRNNCEADRPLREQTGEDLINCPSDCPCEGANGYDSGADGVCQFCNGALGESCDFGAQDWGGDGVPKTCDDTCVDDSGASDFDGRSRRWEKAGQCSDCDPCTDGYDPAGQFNNARWGQGAATEGAGCDHRVDCDGNFSGWCAWGPDSFPDCWNDAEETSATAARAFGFCDPDVVHVRGGGRGEYLFADPNGDAVWATSCPGPMMTSSYTLVAGENVYNGYARGFLGDRGPYRDAPEFFSLDCCGFDPDGDHEPDPTPHQGDGFSPTDECDAGTCIDPPDAGPDAPWDAGVDAPWDGGPDAPWDAGVDAPSDARDGGDAGDARDGGDAGDARDGGDAGDARDGGDAGDARDGGPPGDGGAGDGGPSHCSPVTADASTARESHRTLDGGCGCGAGGDPTSTWALGGLAAALLARRRRRRQP